ncbi:MAG: hypothetical protein VKK42_03175 [Lyngbya sp.]|nr:hypothetical protein [Lyngbya sp.]
MLYLKSICGLGSAEIYTGGKQQKPRQIAIANFESKPTEITFLDERFSPT